MRGKVRKYLWPLYAYLQYALLVCLSGLLWQIPSWLIWLSGLFGIVVAVSGVISLLQIGHKRHTGKNAKDDSRNNPKKYARLNGVAIHRNVDLSVTDCVSDQANPDNCQSHSEAQENNGQNKPTYTFHASILKYVK